MELCVSSLASLPDFSIPVRRNAANNGLQVLDRAATPALSPLLLPSLVNCQRLDKAASLQITRLSSHSSQYISRCGFPSGRHKIWKQSKLEHLSKTGRREDQKHTRSRAASLAYQGYIEVHHPHDSQEDWDDAAEGSEQLSTPKQRKLPPPSSTHSGKSRSKRKGSKATTTESGSDTEREPSNMSSRSSRHSSSSSKKERSSSSKMKKTDDWTEVTEPDERRRIQNRIAQRKFREKAREQKDRAQRDAQNQQYAGAVYHIPDPEDFGVDDGGDLSGLPWGGINMRHVVARGHASASAGQHTHSHHSGHSSSAVTPMHTPGTTTAVPAATAVDQALYNMSPYGYAHPGHGQHGHAGIAGDGSNDHVYYEPPYGAGGYYDIDHSAGNV